MQKPRGKNRKNVSDEASLLASHLYPSDGCHPPLFYASLPPLPARCQPQTSDRPRQYHRCPFPSLRACVLGSHCPCCLFATSWLWPMLSTPALLAGTSVPLPLLASSLLDPYTHRWQGPDSICEAARRPLDPSGRAVCPQRSQWSRLFVLRRPTCSSSFHS